MTRPPAQYLDDITACAETWLRRCNGQPTEGWLVSRNALRDVLALSTTRNVSADENDVITGLGEAGKFTAEPVRDGRERR